MHDVCCMHVDLAFDTNFNESPHLSLCACSMVIPMQHHHHLPQQQQHSKTNIVQRPMATTTPTSSFVPVVPVTHKRRRPTNKILALFLLCVLFLAGSATILGLVNEYSSSVILGYNYYGHVTILKNSSSHKNNGTIVTTLTTTNNERNENIIILHDNATNDYRIGTTKELDGKHLDENNSDFDSFIQTMPIYLLRPLLKEKGGGRGINTTTILTKMNTSSHQTSLLPSASLSSSSSALSFEFAQISWINLTRIWNRTIHYQDLFDTIPKRRRRSESSSSSSSPWTMNNDGSVVLRGTKEDFGIGRDTFLTSLPFVDNDDDDDNNDTASSSFQYQSSSSLSESNITTTITTPPSSSSSTTTTTTRRQQQQRLRIIIVLHTVPKTGSTTLRTSCIDNIQQTCNITQTPSEYKRHAPPGYYNEDILFGLMHKCVNTHYYCARDLPFFVSTTTLGGKVVTTDEATFNRTNNQHHHHHHDNNHHHNTNNHNYFPNTLFIHTFPFRMYDEWVIRALRQQYSRAQEEGCKRVQKLLFNNPPKEKKCQRDNMELDIRKYSKIRMKEVRKSVVQRLAYWKSKNQTKEERDAENEIMEGRNTSQLLSSTMEEENNKKTNKDENEHHMFLLYDHSELQATMELLSTLYDIPILPGLNKRMKDSSGQTERRRKGDKKKTKEDEVLNTTTTTIVMVESEEVDANDHERLLRRRMNKTLSLTIGQQQQHDYAVGSDENSTLVLLDDDYETNNATTIRSSTEQEVLLETNNSAFRCEEEERLLSMFHDCFSDELME